MVKPIKGVIREPSSRDRVEQVTDRIKNRERTTDENPDIDWESQTGAIESALSDGRLKLETGLAGDDKYSREAEIRVRVWDMFKEGIPFDVLNASDKAIAAEQLQSFAEDENHKEDWFDLQKQIELLRGGESLSAEDEDMMAAELKAHKSEAKTLAERAPMPNEIKSAEKKLTKQYFFASPSAFEQMIGRANELGFSEQSGLAFETYTEMKNRYTALQNEMSTAGFFRRLFGLGVQRAEFRDLRSQLDAIDRLASEAVNRSASTMDNRTSKSGRNRIRSARSRRTSASKRVSSAGKGKL